MIAIRAPHLNEIRSGGWVWVQLYLIFFQVGTPHDSYLAMVRHYGCAAGIATREGKTGGTPSGGDIFSKTAGVDTNQDSAG